MFVQVRICIKMKVKKKSAEKRAAEKRAAEKWEYMAKKQSTPMSRTLIARESHHQGDLRYGEHAGAQCTCNVLIFFKSQRLSKEMWTSTEIDTTLEEGQALYRMLQESGCSRYLEPSDFPQHVSHAGQTYSISSSQPMTGLTDEDAPDQSSRLVSLHWALLLVIRKKKKKILSINFKLLQLLEPTEKQSNGKASTGKALCQAMGGDLFSASS